MFSLALIGMGLKIGFILLNRLYNAVIRLLKSFSFWLWLGSIALLIMLIYISWD